MISDNASSAIEIYNLFKMILLFYFFNDSFPSSLNTYQDMKNIAFEKANINFCRRAKLFHKLI